MKMNCSQKVLYLMFCMIILINFSVNAQSPQLIYSTFIGGSNNDGLSNWLNEFAVDDSGNIVFTADTESSNFPLTSDAYDKTYNGGNDWGKEDNVIIKFNIQENKLKYASYFGGRNGPEFVEQVCIRENDFYLVGNTGSSDYPTTVNGYDRSFNGPVFRHADGVISKFQNNELVYSTFLGTSGIEVMSKVLFDTEGNMIVIGQIAKPNELSFTNRFSEETLADNPNGCVIKFNASGNSIIASSLLGPVWEIDAAIDAAGYIYIAGTTPSRNFPVTENAYDNSYNGGDDIAAGDIFIMKLSPQGDQLLFSTFLGGSSDDINPRIRLDQFNNIIIYGRTKSNDFPLTEDALDKIFTGGSELFITKLSNDGKRLIYSSYLGGQEKSPSGELSTSIVVSKEGDVYINGLTDADDHPVTQNALKNSNSGGYDIFITVLDSTLKHIRYSTYIGGQADEVSSAIALDDKNNIICVGATLSSDFPTTTGAFDVTKNGGCDITLSVLSAIDSISTNIGNENRIPQDFQLNQNYPNPFNPSTVISYRLSESSDVKIKIYDVLGREIKTLIDSFQNTGEHSVVWNGTDNSHNQIGSGIYFYSLTTNEISIQKKMILVK